MKIILCIVVLIGLSGCTHMGEALMNHSRQQNQFFQQPKQMNCVTTTIGFQQHTTCY